MAFETYPSKPTVGGIIKKCGIIKRYVWRLSDKIIFREIFWSLNAETHPVFDEEFFVLEDAFISCEIFQCGS